MIANFVYFRTQSPLTRRDQGTSLGNVSAIHRFNAGNLVEIPLPDGGETFLAPFGTAALPTIEIAGGRIVVVPPDEI